MHSTSRAPELSATFSRLSCWIMLLRSLSASRDTRLAAVRSRASALRKLRAPRDDDSSRSFQDFDDAPVLQLRQRTGLGDPHPVALAGVVALVVGIEVAGLLQRLAVAAVTDAVDHRDHHGLVHLGGDHDPLPDLAPGGALLLRGLFGHPAAPLPV